MFPAKAGFESKEDDIFNYVKACGTPLTISLFYFYSLMSKQPQMMKTLIYSLPLLLFLFDRRDSPV